MSADGYDICPACVEKAHNEVQTALDTLAKGYGTLPMEEYEALKAQTRTVVDEEDYRTVREYYEFYQPIETRQGKDRVIRADYSGSCDVCKLEVSFRHDHHFTI
jgi:hypothetical protein